MPHPREMEPWMKTVTREAKVIAPFLIGFAVVGTGVVRLTASLTPEDFKKSKMVNPRGNDSH